jgi:predicted HicB family RNase H-like nuclease
MEHNGHLAEIEFDPSAGQFRGRIVNLPEAITFSGESVDELREALTRSVNRYIATCQMRGVPVEKPFSGKFLLRINPALHRELAIAAARSGKTIVDLIRETLSAAVRTQSTLGACVGGQA